MGIKAMGVKPPRSALIAVSLTVLFLAAVGGVLAYRITDRPGAVQSEGPSIGGPFELTAQTGERFSSTELAGKPFAIFFGFTHCPEVCPTTLYEMSVLLGKLGPQADEMRVLFITVDPERDRPEFLSRYLQSFDPRIIGLTGTEQEIEAVGKAYRVFWEKVPLEAGDYTMNHTASVYLMNADGQFTGTLAWGEDMEVRLQKLRKLANMS